MDTCSKLTSHYILYEKPLNETMRLLLRLDALFTRYEALKAGKYAITLDEQLGILMRLIAVTDRADLKSKLTQLVHQLIHRLQQWQKHKEANQEPITEALKQSQECLTYFDQTRDKIGHHLREQFFIKQLLPQFNHPGGLTDFTLPIYALWQRQIFEQKCHDIHDWMKEFQTLQTCIELLLKFIRQNSDCQTVWVANGFYQQPMDAKKNIQLFQVKVPTAFNVYPNVSVGRHHVSIHFHHVPQAGFDMSEPYPKPFECQLCFCDL
jgi:cell division FtsZ-interacting protein ZapD